MRLLLLVISLWQLSYADKVIGFDDALRIPSVNEFEVYTTYDKKKYLKSALKNKSWQEANQYFLSKRSQMKIAGKKYSTIPYHKVINLLKQASREGVLLAAFQGYRFSSMSTARRGKFAKRDVGYFAKTMMEHHVCLGYIETAFGYTRRWYNTDVDYKNAFLVIEASKASCTNAKLPTWVQDNYKKSYAKYKVMSSYKK